MAKAKRKKASKMGKKAPKKLKGTNKKLPKAIFSGESIASNAKEALDLYSQSRFGEYIDKKVHYSLPEALYLVERGKIEVFYKSKKLSFQKLMEKCKDIDRKIETKYIVFKDIRNRGYIIKTALKFGAEFRVYDKGIKPGQEHAKWILYPVSETGEFTWHDFSAKNRVAHSTKKHLLIAIVDEEKSVTYYEVAWIRP